MQIYLHSNYWCILPPKFFCSFYFNCYLSNRFYLFVSAPWHFVQPDMKITAIKLQELSYLYKMPIVLQWTGWSLSGLTWEKSEFKSNPCTTFALAVDQQCLIFQASFRVFMRRVRNIIFAVSAIFPTHDNGRASSRTVPYKKLKYLQFWNLKQRTISADIDNIQVNVVVLTLYGTIRSLFGWMIFNLLTLFVSCREMETIGFELYKYTCNSLSVVLRDTKISIIYHMAIIL